MAFTHRGYITVCSFIVTAVLSAGAFCFLYALFSLESYPGLTFPSGFKLSYQGCVSAACATNAAWLTVESAVGITMLAPKSEEAMWLGLLIAGSAADLGVFVVYRTKSLSYALTLVWAFVAVFFAQTSFPPVQAVAVLVAVVFSFAAGFIAFKRVKASSAESNGQADALLDSAV